MPHFRTKVLRELRGWDAWNVTEDIDLGLRLARFGYRVEALASSTLEEAPAHLGLWMRQRRRWLKGWMQTALVHARNPLRLVRDMGALEATVAFLHVGGTLLGTLLGPFFAVLTLADVVWGDLLSPQTPLALAASTCWCFVCLAGMAAGLWPLLLGMKRRGLWSCTLWLPTVPLYWTLQTVAAWWALYDLVRDPFHWHKTDHGMAKTRGGAANLQQQP
ncbi:MAG: glycosyltransferase [Beijerinckiaceae bacterium]